MGLDIYFHKTRRNQVGYFRKVNFLVEFFSNVIHEDIGNLSPIEITKDDCEELLDRCNKVLENHELAKELLPVCTGFFFGSYEYDEYYFASVLNVKEFLENTLIPMFDELKEDEYIEFEIWY